MEHLAKSQEVFLAGQLEVTADEDDNAPCGGGGRLRINGGDGVAALIEWKLVKLGRDVVDSQNLVSLEGEHGGGLVERTEGSSIVVEEMVVVIYKNFPDQVHLIFHCFHPDRY